MVNASLFGNEAISMKTSIRVHFFIPVLFAVLGLITGSRVTAQTYTILYSFPYGADIENAMILSSNRLYGTTQGGTLFAINTDGTGFTNIYSVGGYANALILLGNRLYGTTAIGGSYNRGTVYAVNTDGSDYTNMHSFNGEGDGSNPAGGLTLSGNTLFGTTSYYGNSGGGTVFSINSDGSSFTNLHNFTGGNDGGGPAGDFIVSGSTLYGAAGTGGAHGSGTVYAINTDGTGFTNLYSFTPQFNNTNSDGADPNGGLILSGNTLYGMAFQGGVSSYGTVFAVNTNGTGFTNLYNFTGGNDGAFPRDGLILSGNTLYGTAWYGGSYGLGTVFAVNTDGTGFITLQSFSGGTGYGPIGGLVISSNILYGTTFYGAYSYNSVVFALSLIPSLEITLTGNQVVLSWPTWAPNF
jgi:uncharacterized repeat protein (TIGR03803 family)